MATLEKLERRRWLGKRAVNEKIVDAVKSCIFWD